MRTLAIGDIHGCLTALDTLLGAVGPTEADRLIFLGDYVDRGPDTRGVLERLIDVQRDHGAICLRGNHEIMMANATTSWDGFKYWQHYGGDEALASYTGDEGPATLDDVPESHWDFLARCADSYEAEGHIFVHAGLHPDMDLDLQIGDWLHWKHLDPVRYRPHVSGKTMVCGHTQQRSGEPLVLERAVCIDTSAYDFGWLTCLHVETGEYWQANELGQIRTGQLVQ